MHDSATYDEDPSIEAADQDDRIWGAIAHLSTLLPIPLFNLLGPIIVMLAKGSESYFIRKQAVSALNFQLSVIIGYIICIPLVFIIIGIPLMWAIGIGSMICSCIAGIKSFEGKTFSYPMSFHFMS